MHKTCWGKAHLRKLMSLYLQLSHDRFIIPPNQSSRSWKKSRGQSVCRPPRASCRGGYAVQEGKASLGSENQVLAFRVIVIEMIRNLIAVSQRPVPPGPLVS